ncbi:MAG: hypothetical protein Q8P02_05115, partial [Candidatus Micrarchaeota archaeon]|nr:hypothetical protein [Candidatus Micrarchaeota archaeon]
MTDSARITAYIDAMHRQSQKAMALAQKAREQGKDPVSIVEIPLAHDVSARVEGLVGPVGVAEA